MSRLAPSKEPPIDNGVREMLAMVAKLRRQQNTHVLGSEASR
jgi:hypothetical protein